MDNIVALIKKGFNDSHPKVRFAAIQALGQLSDDLNLNNLIYCFVK